MSAFPGKIRTPEKNTLRKRQIAVTIGIVLLGFALGVLQKWLDSLPGNRLPLLLEQLDIRNYFGRLAI